MIMTTNSIEEQEVEVYNSFDSFTNKAKATRTLETYDEKNRRLVNFVASNDAFKSKFVVTTTDLYKEVTLPLTVDLIKAFFNKVVVKADGSLLSNSSIGSYKSAMAHYYEINNMPMPGDEVKALFLLLLLLLLLLLFLLLLLLL